MTEATDGPFPGRDEQLAQLETLLPTDGGGPRTALLAGDDGAGRAELVSRLAEAHPEVLALRWRFQSGDDSVATLLRLHAGCAASLTRGGDIADRTRDALRGELDGEADPRRAAWIRAFLDSLDSSPRTGDGGIQLQLPQDNPYWGLLQLVLGIASVTPLVLELQRVNAVSSPAFWTWLWLLRREVARRELPVLWVVSAIESPFGESRDDPLPTPSGLMGELLAGTDATVELPALDGAAVQALVDARYRPNQFPEGTGARLGSLTDGNPARLADLLDLLESEEIVAWDETAGYQLDRPLDALHLDTLVPDPEPEGEAEGDPQERADLAAAALQVAAIEGVTFTAGVVAETLGQDKDAIDDLLDELPQLVEEARFQPAIQSWTYRFLRPTFRQHHLELASAAGPTRTRKMARALMERFVPAAQAYIPLTARLFNEVGQARQARNLLALAMGSDRLDLSRAAQELVSLQGAETLPVGLLRLLYAEAAERAVNGAAAPLANELIGGLEAFAGERDEAALAAFASLLRSRLAMREGDMDTAVARGEEALAGFGDDPVRRAETLNHLALLALRRRDAGAARNYVELAGKASTIPPVKAYSVFIRGLLRRGERKMANAAEAFGEAARLAMDAGNPLLGLEARLNQGEMLMVTGRARVALEPLRLARQMAVGMRAKPLERSATTLLAQAEAANGNAGEAFDLARDALALGQELGLAEMVAADQYHCGLFGLAAGETAEARTHLDQALAAVTQPDGPLAKEIHFHRGQLQLVEGELDGARTSLARTREIATSTGDPVRAARALQVLGMVEEKAGDPAAALRLYREAVDEMGIPSLQAEREAVQRRIAELEAEH